MREILYKLQKCMDARFPTTVASLNSGANEAEIAALEQHIGILLPEQVRELYRWHNGQSEDSCRVIGLFFGMPFSSIDRVIQHWDRACSVLRKSSAQELEAWSKDYSCVPVATIKQAVMSRSWIPLSDDSAGNYLGLDFDPDVNGSVAQIISFGGREFTRVRAAESLEKFLENLLFLYEHGQYELIEEGENEFSISTVSPSTDHFLDYLRMKAEE